MSKTTVASSLMKSLKSRLLQLAKSFDIGICCSKCAVTPPDGPKGEYFLLGYTPNIEEGICFSGHKTCSRNWILCRENSMGTWFRVRPIYAANPELPNSISVCEYTIKSGSASARKCPSGEMCVNAHSDVEYSVWTLMIDLGLDYDKMREILLEEIDKYKAQTMIQCDGILKDDIAAVSGDPITPPMNIPEDAVRPGCRYEEQGFFVKLNTKTYLVIHATRVDGPDRVYFQLCENIERMEKCWKDIDSFYKSNEGDNYKMVQDDLLRNLPIAAKFSSKGSGSSKGNACHWRRAEILDYTLGDDCSIEVMDVDFGAVGTVKLEDTRLLRADYFAFKKQAIEGMLGYIHPANGDHWTTEAIDVTKKFFKKWPLVAEVVGMINGNLALMVCDTSDPKTDVYLADLLIKEGHAVAFNAVEPLVFYGKESLCYSDSEIKPSMPDSR